MRNPKRDAKGELEPTGKEGDESALSGETGLSRKKSEEKTEKKYSKPTVRKFDRLFDVGVGS